MYYSTCFVFSCIELLCMDKMLYKHCTMYAYNSSWIESIARHWMNSLLCCNHDYVHSILLIILKHSWLVYMAQCIFSSENIKKCYLAIHWYKMHGTVHFVLNNSPVYCTMHFVLNNLVRSPIHSICHATWWDMGELCTHIVSYYMLYGRFITELMQ